MSRSTRASHFARAAAVLSSVSLFAVYVAYRSGGQTTTPAPTTTPSFPGSKIGIVQLPTTTTSSASTTPPSAPATTRTISPEEFRAIYSSKSAPVFQPGAFGGSKSAAVFQPADATVILQGADPVIATTHPTTASATRPAKVNVP